MTFFQYAVDGGTMRTCLELIERHAPRLGRYNVRLLPASRRAPETAHSRHPRVTPAELECLRLIAIPGKSLNRIAKEWGRSTTAAFRGLRKLGIDLPHPASDLRELRQLRAQRLLATRMRKKDIARELGVSPSTVSALLKGVTA